jgi:uncharacterized protein
LRILVDADSCPVKETIIEIAQRHGVRVTMVASYAHHIDFGSAAEVVRVDQEAESADIAILNRTRTGDIVVTGDYGLASLVIARKAHALSPRGNVFREQNIEGMLNARHEARRRRRGGGRVKGPKAFSSENLAEFQSALEALLRSHDPAPRP